jgi:hypothetical protein
MLKLRESWKKGLFAVAASVVIAMPMLAAPQAQAQEAGGIAYLELNDVSFTWASDGDTVEFNDVNIGSSAANTGDTEATLVSVGSDSDTDSTLISAGGSVDPLRSCVGDCASAPTENSQTVTTGLVGTSYSSSDAFLAGSTIDIDGLGVTAGATAVARADSQLNTTDTSSANSNVGTTTQFSFSVDADRAGDALVFNYDFVTRLYAELSPDAGGASSVLVAVNWTISITDQFGNVYMSESPILLNQTRSVGDLFGGPIDFTASADGQTITSLALEQTVNGVTAIYTLTIRHNANLDATLVTIPEPGALALFALGLIALSAVGWRSRKMRRPSDASEV